MKFSAIESQNIHFYSPRFEIRVAGKDILGEKAEVVSLTVNEIIDGASRVSFTVLNEELRWLTSPLFTLGGEVEVVVGYKNPLETIFVGDITELKPTFPADGASQLEVSGLDFSERMKRGCRFQSWEEVKDSDIAKEIAGRHKLRPSGVESTKVVHPKVKQNGESDFAFLEGRAKNNRFEVAVQGRTLVFAPPEDQASAPEVTTLNWGESLISFSPELNTAGPVSEVTVRGWNPTAKKAIVGKATWEDLPGNQPGRQSGGEIVERIYGRVQECVRDEPVYTQEEANERALAVLREKADTLIKGRGESIGIPEIRIRSSIILTGLGPFSMKYYITGTTHSISSSGYKTTFQVKGDTYAGPR